MTDPAILLNISEMIDLALGTPEVGVVDFNMLQTVLHCLAQQLRVLGKNVELRGSIAALPVSRENTQTIAVSEYTVVTDETPKATKVDELSPQPSEKETMLVVERVKRSDSPTTRSPPRALSPTPASPGPPEKVSLVTLSKFNLLENTVEDLKNRVYGSMPKNEEILQEVRSQTNLKAITDMWTSLNVSSRLEAAETGLAKLSSLVQDVINDTTGLQDALKNQQPLMTSTTTQPSSAPPTSASAPPSAAPATSETAPAPSETAPATSETAPAPQGTAPAPPPAAPAPQGIAPVPSQAAVPPSALSGSEVVLKEDLNAVDQKVQILRADLDALSKSFYTTIKDLQAGVEPSALSLPPPSVPAPVAPPTGPPPQSFSASTADIMNRINDLDKRLKKCCDHVGKNDGVVQDQINALQDQLEHLLKETVGLSQGASKMSPDLLKDMEGLMQLFQTVQEMQDQLKQVHETALQLAAEKEDRQHHLNSLLEQIELLKTIKMDREDMAEAMAEKADMRLLARKVSHDQFELACDDLSKGLEHALGKLNLQEALWQQALDDIQREIESKLDKIELSPVKEFFNSKLMQLQDNLKQMASLRREAEAAGAKRRLMRGLNCISCDAQAVMAMDMGATLPVSKPLPPTLSMKPYLSYELDTIRKTQASNMPQRNMRDWENIDKQMAQSKQPQRVRSDTEKHICNRYCGGSHTVTTPAQRVARLGHFIKQWGPEVLPLSSGLAAGDDGRMYKVTTGEGAKAGTGTGGAVEEPCTPKSPRTGESSKPPKKALVISAECRCLEGDHQ